MPIYEYQCEVCGQVLDALQKFSDPPLKKCPSCGKAKLKRLLSAPMFLLKGSGWYETDFKSDKERRKNLADRPEPEAKSGEASADTKVDNKADSKADSKTDSKADAPAAGKAEAKPEEKKADKKEAGSPARAPAGRRTRSRAKPRSRRR